MTLCAVVALTVVGLAARSSLALPSPQSSHRVRSGKGATRMASRKPKKTVHAGKSGAANGAADWIPCQSTWRPVSVAPIVKLDAVVTGGTATIQPATPEQAQGVYDAAFSTCFLEDIDPEGPKTTANKPGLQRQYDELTLPAGGVPSTLRFRPAADAPDMSMALLQENEGYIIGDFINVTDSADFVLNGKITIKPFHSVLLWMGKAKGGAEYSAIIDLRGFPTHASGGVNDVVAKMSGRVVSNQRTLNSNAFARFAEPHMGIRPRVYPDGAWVDCNPGCCVVNFQ